jgi:PII-like signaling protein
LPVLVEIVDSREKIACLLPFLDEVVQEGLITIESVRVIKYQHAQGSSSAP